MQTEHWSLERYRAELAKPKRNKFNAQPCYCDGHSIISLSDYNMLKENGVSTGRWSHFPSEKEARRYVTLTLAQAAGAIRGLRRQVRYPLRVNGVHVATYVSDFEYTEDGKAVTEDCKGHRTRLYKMKRALMLAIYGVEIRET